MSDKDDEQTDEHEWEFDKEFHMLCNNPEQLKKGVEKFLTDTIDLYTLGIVFDIHRKFKTNAYNKDVCYDPEKLNPPPLGVDIFGNANTKKNMEVACPNCNKRNVTAIK